MRRFTFVTATLAALAAFPALAAEDQPASPVHDPFSQVYDGLPQKTPAAADQRDPKQATPCSCECAHGHHAAASSEKKA